MEDNEGLFLPESILMRFAPEDEGWVGDLPALPDEAIAEIRTVLKTRLTPSQSKQVELQLMRDFGTAVVMAKAECVLRQAANQERAGSKKKSAKLGVRLRTKLGKLRAEFEGDAVPDENGICARILEDPVLERLVTPFIEERTGGKVVDPLRNAPSVAIRHLQQFLDSLFRAVDKGVATGRAEPALNFLAECVVRAVFRATGKIPGRTWDAYDPRETGAGVETCRILAAALNNALPEDFRRSHPAESQRSQ